MATFARDAFSRSVSNAWNTDDLGNTWTITLQTGSSDADVNGTQGTLSIGVAGQNTQAALASLGQQNYDITASYSIPALPTGAALFLHQGARSQDTTIANSTRYVSQLECATSGVITTTFSKFLTGTQTTIGTAAVATGVTVTAGSTFYSRFVCVGTNPTLLLVKVWTGATEPATWTYGAIDSAAALQTTGGASLRLTSSGSETLLPIIWAVNDYLAITATTAITSASFAGTGASLANAGTSENSDAWVSPGNVVSDNATEASITAATYDSPDISELLVASNFGLSAVTGQLDGIVAEIDRRSIIASSGKDSRVQLSTSTAFAGLVGSNKAVPATIWPSTTAVATYGHYGDIWGSSLTPAQVGASGFALMLSVTANIANADIGVDFVRVTATYTPHTTVTPTTLALTITTFAPVIKLVVIPDVAALTLTTFAPTVTTGAPQLATPTTLALTTATFAPTITATAHQLVTPGTLALTTSAFAPTVSTPVLVTPTTASVVLSTFAPTVSAPRLATPTTLALSLTTFAPTVTATAHVTATPTTLALTLATFAPTVSAPRLATPTTLALTITSFAPTIGAGASATPTTASLTLTTFAPTVSATANVLVTPPTKALVLTSFAPTVLAPRLVTPATKALTLTTFAPLLTSAKTVVPDSAALSLTTFAPTVSFTAHVRPVPTTASLVLVGYVPFIVNPKSAEPLPASLVITGRLALLAINPPFDEVDGDIVLNDPFRHATLVVSGPRHGGTLTQTRGRTTLVVTTPRIDGEIESN